MRQELERILEGRVADDETTLATYSRDASLCEVKPHLVVFPRGSEDIQKLVRFVSERKTNDPTLSITARAAGSCMSGGPLGESIILDTSRYMRGVPSFDGSVAEVLPGTFYRDFEKETLRRGLILPCYTASKDLCALGGMIGNNAAGEKTLRYGKMEDYVESLSVVFSDGNEYEVRLLSSGELKRKISQNDFEAEIYRKVFALIEENREEIERARPKVSKNSAGYYLWNVWDGQTFNLVKLLVGSQGTLGIVTRARLRLVPVTKHSRLFVIFLKDLSCLSELVNIILRFRPESLESYDDSTLRLAVRFFPEMVGLMKGGLVKLLWSFLPEIAMVLTGGVPKLVLLAEFTGETNEAIERTMHTLENTLLVYKLQMHVTKTEDEAGKYWTIRRQSFNLLRRHIRGKRTAPFVDDVVVDPKYLPEFLPRMRAILDEYKLVYTIAGHAGNGNFHIIPLMDMRDCRNVSIILEVSDKVYDLVARYGGSITAEHNDGIIRTPYLGKMFSPKMLELFAEVKNIFDPRNIFNPGKKVGGSVEYLKEHISGK
ncbi:FAD-binding oxidoreductase [Patescibacteria group bacterium]|nr:MAG: FAD-binding oxidoreductase [Patescibacteria group bacterium]